MAGGSASGGLQLTKLGGLPPVSGSVVANWNTGGEQTVFTVGAAGVRYKVQYLIVNIVATGGNITLRFYTLVNGVLTRIFPPKAGTTFNNGAGDGPGIALINGTYEISNPLVITAQSDAPGDDGTALSYEYGLEAM
jgi:hypothetical protein